jgi:hypothetical protein
MRCTSRLPWPCGSTAMTVLGMCLGGLAGARGLPEHGDLVAEKILRWLKGSPQGLGNNEIRDLFRRAMSQGKRSAGEEPAIAA